ncbi:MAG: acetyl-CoA hydrolase/transferase family protein [Veillonellaceae bacterium]|nr:acetyl-CoA hydrolase/transferase family protein [Veillonellaceae bacterium]
MDINDIRDRIRCEALLGKVMTAEEAAAMINPNDHIGISGFTPSGYPKAVPLALEQRIREEHFKIDLWTGASVGPEADQSLVECDGMNRRFPYQTNSVLRKAINSGKVHYIDMHLSHVAQQVRTGFFGELDVAIIEVCAITEDGNLVPTTALGNSPVYATQAKKIIVEVNTSQPLELEGMHDIYQPANPPHRKPIPIEAAGDRIGTTYIEVDTDKIVAIVPTDITDKTRPFAPIGDDARAMSGHLIEFLSNEIKQGRLPESLLPLQSGVGNVANAVISGLVDSPYENLTVYTEVIQDGMFDLIDAGKLLMASGTSLSPSPDGLKRFYAGIKDYRDKIVLRPQEISNNPEVIRRLGVIAMNTALEMDIYGNVNSTHVTGTKMMNGIGGSGDFARNGSLSIFFTNSVAKGGDISCIVPFASHIDHSEHDVHVYVSELGVADVRGLSPKERARVIINNIVHPDYRDMLLDYLKRAEQKCGFSQTPHMLDEAMEWYTRFNETGSMKK